MLASKSFSSIRSLTSKLSTLTTSRTYALKPTYDNIIITQHDKVSLITLNRPKALNALCDAMLDDLIHATGSIDLNPDVGCIVITGSEKAFAAGADIKEMADKTFAEAYGQNMFANWALIGKVKKPTIAAVNGFALGGGCELAMMCTMIVAGDKAKFGQPEINLGIIPGCGGTQRLIRAVGKSKAMEMCLTGSMIDAERAERDGLVCKVVPSTELIETCLKMGNVIASKGHVATAMVVETVNAAYELNLEEGMRFERRSFHSLFATVDQKEGMKAFIEKRKAVFVNK